MRPIPILILYFTLGWIGWAPADDPPQCELDCVETDCFYSSSNGTDWVAFKITGTTWCKRVMHTYPEQNLFPLGNVDIPVKPAAGAAPDCADPDYAISH